MHDNGNPSQPDGYQLLIRARLVDFDEGLAGCCNLCLEGPDDSTPLEEMDKDVRETIVGLLLETILISLARQETTGPVLGRALASLSPSAEPTTDTYSFSSEDNNLENSNNTTQGSK